MKRLLKNIRIWALGLILIGFTTACTEDAALDEVIDGLQEVPTLNTGNDDNGHEKVPGEG